ncbi:unnamed protein product [Linum tenue]|uniref:BHLH domain-containing protein n=2 Tax=Linum tenue TaxID=586396 RepID=A0AAV0LAQ0_9ROSI|nr:unnamed protein product [Linum tenue]
MEDYKFFQHCDTINSQLHMAAAAAAGGESLSSLQPSFSSESYSSYSGATFHHTTPNVAVSTMVPAATRSGSNSMNETSQQSYDHHHSRPAKQQKRTNSWSSSVTTDHHHHNHIDFSSSHTSQMLSFDNNNNNNSSSLLPFSRNNNSSDPTVQPKDEADNLMIPNRNSYNSSDPFENTVYAPKGMIKTRPFSSMATTTRSPSHAQDHILAERKRREKLSQRFIALSSIVPGLKKMDKASVLGDAIKYVKHLQEKIKQLEEQTKKRTVESVVLVKRYHLPAADDDDDHSNSSSNDDADDDTRRRSVLDKGCSDSTLPEIEARASERDVMIRIHCEKQPGVLAKVLSEVESLRLSIVNSSVLPFGNSTLDITIVAQMDGEFSMKVIELVKNLRLAFLKFM